MSDESITELSEKSEGIALQKAALYITQCKNENCQTLENYVEEHFSFSQFNSSDKGFVEVIGFFNLIRTSFETTQRPVVPTTTVELFNDSYQRCKNRLTRRLDSLYRNISNNGFELTEIGQSILDGYSYSKKRSPNLKGTPKKLTPSILQDQLTKLQAKYDELNEELHQTKSENNSHLDLINELQSVSSIQIKRIKSLESELAEEKTQLQEFSDSNEDLKIQNTKLSAQNEKLQEQVQEVNLEIAELLSGQQEQRGVFEMIDEIVDKNKEPEMHKLVTRLASLPEDDREEELKRIYSNVDEYRGARVDGSAYDFTEKHWGVWLKLRWAGRKHLRSRGGAKYIIQLKRELETKDINFDDYAMNEKAITDFHSEGVSDATRRAISTKIRRNYL